MINKNDILFQSTSSEFRSSFVITKLIGSASLGLSMKI